MSKVRETLDAELASLKTLRDEIRVKAHLFRADLRDEWAKVDKRLDVIESELNRFAREAKDPLAEAGSVAGELLDEAAKALDRMRARVREG